ncbi:hypothetical protein ES288_1Z030400v1 [Gossypium darwinii]|uniref:Uncharacterized protein n=1 Tax=Gossypium darwinii TaxID=34276 RepID=A0A5C7J0B6_GOSDA|nr:hypothetical protein ES288_1Z037300v1 [Gossypium darwinii]TXG74975.1 hypothetical protein ES288_1Z030400v1 [Gossypium darwinii]
MKLVADKRPNGTNGEVYVPLGDKPLNGGHPKRAIPAYGHNTGTAWYFSKRGKCIADVHLKNCSKFVDNYWRGILFYDVIPL